MRDLFSNVSTVRRLPINSGLNTSSVGDFLLYTTTYLVLLHYVTIQSEDLF